LITISCGEKRNNEICITLFWWIYGAFAIEKEETTGKNKK